MGVGCFSRIAWHELGSVITSPMSEHSVNISLIIALCRGSFERPLFYLRVLDTCVFTSDKQPVIPFISRTGGNLTEEVLGVRKFLALLLVIVTCCVGIFKSEPPLLCLSCIGGKGRGKYHISVHGLISHVYRGKILYVEG